MHTHAHTISANQKKSLNEASYFLHTREGLQQWEKTAYGAGRH